MTVVLALMEPIGSGSQAKPDALCLRPTDDAQTFGLMLRSRGVVADLTFQEGLGLAARLDWILKDLVQARPARDEYRWPYYQSTPCPWWCDIDHTDDCPVSRREHLTQGPPEVELLRRGRLVSTVEVSFSQHFDWAAPRIFVAVTGEVLDLVIEMSAVEADRLSHLLRGAVDLLSPGLEWHGLDGEERERNPYEWWLDHSDPADWPLEERTPPDPQTRRRNEEARARRAAETSRRCSNSGGQGVMIEIPGMDDWKVRCPECGTTWGGGPTSPLDQHDQP